ncbi:oxidoreductase YcsN [Acrasis kona]|uniref:Oxidoreductase YcsN n=1 Tax=Acrasis kona TaxID=1008807 RepID=A0AAW2YM11_9EUKA
MTTKIVPLVSINNNAEKSVDVSQIQLGAFRWVWGDFSLKPEEAFDLFSKSRDIGITTLDTADVYGDYQCNKLVGSVIGQLSNERDQIQIVGKTGIRLISKHYPEIHVAHYNTESEYIYKNIRQQLIDVQTDYFDILNIHRPDYLLNPRDLVDTFEKLRTEGMVKNFGVSNFDVHQFDLLQSECLKRGFSLVTNQVEFSISHLNPTSDLVTTWNATQRDS